MTDAEAPDAVLRMCHTDPRIIQMIDELRELIRLQNHNPAYQRGVQASIETIQEMWMSTASESQARKLWIVRYWHRFGDDCWPEFIEPTEQSVVAGLIAWEGDREDEGIEIFGPFDISDEGRPR